MKNREKYRQLFRQEATKLLTNIAGHLLELEEDPEKLAPLRQDLHTLKGSARLVNLAEIGELAHLLEDYCVAGSALARGEQEAVDLALEAVDALEGMAGLGKPEPSPEELQALRGRLGAPGAGGPKPAAAAAPGPELPSPTELATPRPRLQASGVVDAPREPLSVPIEELDHLLNLSGELLLQHHRMVARFDQGRQLLGLIDTLRRSAQHLDGAAVLDEVASEVGSLTRDMEADMVEAGFLFSEVRERTAGVRMQAFSSLVEPMQRQVRADGRRLGKKVDLKMRGGHLPIDRGILEYLRPVLLHTVTNSVAHGIEMPEARRAQGKPEAGVIRVAASIDGNRIRILVEDDGCGLDASLLREAAVRKGLVSDEEAREMEDEEALHLIFTPGFSTAKVVSNIAGRGVGMDAVRASVERLRGQIHIESERGRYTRISLLLPAAIGVVHGLVVEVAGEELGLPMGEVAMSVYERTATEAIPDDAPYLGELLGWEGPEPEPGERWWVFLKDAQGVQPVRVDRVVRDQELVLKFPGNLLAGLPFVGGATVYASGQVGMVLKVPDLMRELRRELAGELASSRPPGSGETLSAPPRPEPAAAALEEAAPLADLPTRLGGSILVVDDSPVARTLLKEAVANAGFPVLEARDGEEALALMGEQPVILVVTDYEMPNLDGMELLARVRDGATPVPVLLLTSRAAELRGRAEQAGAAGVYLKGGDAFPEVVAHIEELLA